MKKQERIKASLTDSSKPSLSLQTARGRSSTPALFRKHAKSLLLALTLLSLAQPSTALQTKLSLEDFLNLHYQGENLAPPPKYVLIRPVPKISPSISFEASPKSPALPPLYTALSSESVQLEAQAYKRKTPIPEPDISFENKSTGALPPIHTVLSSKPTELSLSAYKKEIPQLKPHISFETAPKKIPTPPLSNRSPKLVIIIDDIGNNRFLDTRTAQLPGPVTLAILPHRPFSKDIAKLGHQLGKDIMLHAPMESLNNRKLGEGALTQELNQEQFSAILQYSIDSIPHISGVNNHMGSSLTENPQAMDWVMEGLIANGLFFVDSKTTPRSVAGQKARQYQIDNLTRHVFLDNESTPQYIDRAFKQALKISKRNGFALAIGHPYPETIEYLENTLPTLKEQGILLVSTTTYIDYQKEQKELKMQQKDLAKNNE